MSAREMFGALELIGTSSRGYGNLATFPNGTGYLFVTGKDSSNRFRATIAENGFDPQAIYDEYSAKVCHLLFRNSALAWNAC